jgi:lysophospholipase L1-like esterase
MSGRLVRLVSVVALAAAGILGSGAAASASGSSGAAKFASPHPFYLALGDSLARGVQPDSTGHSVITDQGYVDDVYADESANVPRLQLVNLGCPGESTTTMINGGICTYAAGSQLAQAVRFLKQHAAQTQLVTIDFPDAMTSGLRRSTDAARGILEKTRGDLTVAIRQRDLESRLASLEGRLGGGP